MFVFAPSTLPCAADWLLRPHLAAARRYEVFLPTRPWQLYGRTMQLVEKFFPNEVHRALALMAENETLDYPGWVEVLLLFFERVNRDWFPLNDRMIEDFIDAYYQIAGEDEDEDDGVELPGGLAELSDYVDGIPVMFYGYGVDSAYANDINEEPVMSLLDGLLGRGLYRHGMESRPEFEVFDLLEPPEDGLVMDCYQDVETMMSAGGSEDWYGDLKLACRDLAEPLCRLPEVARYACGCTGNPLLDRVEDTWDSDPYEWEWDKPGDIDDVRRWWAHAKVVLDWSAALGKWAATNDRLKIIYDLVTKGSYDGDDA